MAVLPIFRVIIFTLVTLLSLVVLGICAHIEYLATGYMDLYLSFAPFGLGAGCLTVLSLPLFMVLSNRRQRVFTSTIVFETIWLFILWVVWVGTAGDAVVGRAYYFPAGCVYDDYPPANQTCYEFTVVEACAFFNFFCAFIYYDIIVLYAIINAIRGRGIWTASVREAASGTLGTVNPVPMVQPQFNAAPATQCQTYGAYPINVPLAQPYSPYPQQVLPQGHTALPYGTYPQQVSPQGYYFPQPYSAYPNQTLQGPPTMQPDQNQPYNYNFPHAAPQQQANYAGFSPTPPIGDAPPPPQPNYSSYPVSVPQDPLPLPSGYQEEPIPVQHQMESPTPSSPYGSHQVPPV